MANPRQAVLDIGSNTIRLLIVEISNQTTQRIHYQHHIARLAEGLGATGVLGSSGMLRAMQAFQNIIVVCAKFDIQPHAIRAVATAAVREAANGKLFVAEVLAKTGIGIEIVSGEMEASLALAGAKFGLDTHIASDMLLFDIGGGSTEFTRVFQGEMRDTFSTKTGVVRLIERVHVSSQPLAEEYALLCHAAEQWLQGVEAIWGKHFSLPTYWVGTAGTVTTIAAIAQNMQVYQAEKINGFVLTRAHFDKIKHDLLGKTNAQRLAIPALEPGREDVIIAGLAMLDMMFARWGYASLISVDSGLLEGMLV